MKKSIIKKWELRFVAYNADDIPNIKEMRQSVFQHFTQFIKKRKNEWQLTDDKIRICGYIDNDDRFKKGEHIITSPVVLLKKDGNTLYATTKSGTVHALDKGDMSDNMLTQLDKYRKTGIVTDDVEIVFIG